MLENSAPLAARMYVNESFWLRAAGTCTTQANTRTSDPTTRSPVRASTSILVDDGALTIPGHARRRTSIDLGS